MSTVVGPSAAPRFTASPISPKQKRAVPSARSTAWRAGLLPWLVPLLLIAGWELAARVGWLSSRILPEPFAVGRAAWSLTLSGELWKHVSVSAWRAISGFVVGGGCGLLLGLLTGTFKNAETLLDTTIQMIRNIPALA
ncbi:ABC transporter permease, partial [Glaciimonas sp. CA11.2]|nr:ABC transporter permease [Glaciimonas sp. CA11.2]